MKRAFGTVLLAVVLCLLAGPAALAGYKCGTAVYVYSGSYAVGQLADARSSPDTRQGIGCLVQAHPNGTTYTYCWASDNAGNYAACYSTSPQIAAAASGMSGDSQVAFYFDGTGACTELDVNNHSCYAPKQP